MIPMGLLAIGIGSLGKIMSINHPSRSSGLDL